MTEPKLKPCPFCGGDVGVETTPEEWGYSPEDDEPTECQKLLKFCEDELKKIQNGEYSEFLPLSRVTNELSPMEVKPENMQEGRLYILVMEKGKKKDIRLIRQRLAGETSYMEDVGSNALWEYIGSDKTSLYGPIHLQGEKE